MPSTQAVAKFSGQAAIILAELGLPYTIDAIWDLSELKKAPFTDINPNGRAPGKPSTLQTFYLTHWERLASRITSYV